MNIQKPYKEYQQLYNDLVRVHSDDFANMEFIIEDELVENALKYFDAATFPLIYPAKSYAVAIIYAVKLNEHYGYDIRESLDDPELFLGQDAYFVPYSIAPDVYDEILARLDGREDWISKGWAPQTVHYFEAECTEEGLTRVINGMEGSV